MINMLKIHKINFDPVSRLVVVKNSNEECFYKTFRDIRSNRDVEQSYD